MKISNNKDKDDDYDNNDQSNCDNNNISDLEFM